MQVTPAIGDNSQADHAALREGVRAVVSRFDDEYWLERDEDGHFPREFSPRDGGGRLARHHHAGGLGGAGLGVTEAAIMMHAVLQPRRRHGGGLHRAHQPVRAAPHRGARHARAEAELAPASIAGKDEGCFGVTEPNAGLDTTPIETFAAEGAPGRLPRHGPEGVDHHRAGRRQDPAAHPHHPLERRARGRPTASRCSTPTSTAPRSRSARIPKMGRKAVDFNTVFIDDLFVPDEDRIGEEGRGFTLYPRQPQPRAHSHRHRSHRHRPGCAATAPPSTPASAWCSAVRSARTRASSIRSRECWTYLESGLPDGRMRAASLYDSGKPCGAEANAAKFLGARAGYDACLQAVLTHGGIGYAKEYHVERLLREVMIARIAPVTEQLIFCIAEKVLDLPKSVLSGKKSR